MTESIKQDDQQHTHASASSGFLSNLRLVSLGTVVSRVFGLLRDMGMTSVFGAGTVLDAFIVAFRIPNLARQLLGEGALSTAFLPVFVKCRAERGDQSAREMMTAVALAVAILLTGLISVGELGLLAAWWWGDLSAATGMLVLLLAIMLPYSLLICLSALFCAALHAQRQFLWPVLVPITLNLIWLGALGIAASIWKLPVPQAMFSAAAVTFAGCVQLLIPLFALRRQGMGLIRSWRAGWPFVGDVFRAMLPVVVGMSILQMSAILDSVLAWGLSRPDDGSAAWCQMLGIAPVMESGTASALYIGQRMYQFPLGVFGVALGTVLYPLLTQHAQRGEYELLRSDLSRGLRIMLAVAIPASAGLSLLAWPLTLALFQHGEFNRDDALLTSRMIAIYGAGVWCYIGIAILNRAFYATGDRVTPMRFGFLALVLNLICNLILIFQVGGIGIALGSVFASTVQVLLTLRKLNRQVGPLHWPEILSTLWKGILATVLMSAACMIALQMLPAPETLLDRLLSLGVPCLVGAGTYFAVARLTGMKELDELLRRS
ncbi:murein biosynthesis integral membrane protein MurJ [Planctomicrobium sp. SH661]|uniref:murein biosynthesis integral membrane protein MurJ n=1 Tax=Planctomicrobium sp. SH661 TaxID=3448124 RepID=UPI003F5C6D47